jgi:hypothetical protein
MTLLLAVLVLTATRSPLDHTEPAAVLTAATSYLDTLKTDCPADPACMQKFKFGSGGSLQRAAIGEPWSAFVMTYKDFRETEYQDLLKVARFNYFACPIVVDGEYRGIVRVCRDPDEPDAGWTSCGSRGPTRLAEVNTFNLTLAPESDSLHVICVLTVQNNARYILVKKGTEYFAVAASDVAAELIGVNVRHVSRMTMYPLNEVLYKLQVSAIRRHTKPR